MRSPFKNRRQKLAAVLSSVVLLPSLLSTPADARTVRPIATTATTPQAETTSTPMFGPTFGELPLAFVPNQGQAPSDQRFWVDGFGGGVSFQPNQLTFSLPIPLQAANTRTTNNANSVDDHTSRSAIQPSITREVQVALEGANTTVEITGTDQLPGVVNYLLGDDPAQWRVGVPTYQSIVYKNVYNGIDLRYDGVDGALKATYIVAPGANPSQIRWRYDGANVQIDSAGQLTANIDAQVMPSDLVSGARLEDTDQNALLGKNVSATLSELPPVSWQESATGRQPVTTRYAQRKDGSIGFAVDSYDTTKPLVLDPTYVYRTYIGGSKLDTAQDVAVTSDGAMYITGYTYSTGLGTTGVKQKDLSGGSDAFVMRLNPSGTSLDFRTYLGGSKDDLAYSIAVDTAGAAYITGRTSSSAFPRANAIQTALSGTSDAFISKLSKDGKTLVYSTYFGGTQSDGGDAIDIFPDGRAVIAGETRSSDIPFGVPNRIQNPQGESDIFLAQLSTKGTIEYGGYLGGRANEYLGGLDRGGGLDVDPRGNIYVTGMTSSDNFLRVRTYQYTCEGILMLSSCVLTEIGIRYLVPILAAVVWMLAQALRLIMLVKYI